MLNDAHCHFFATRLCSTLAQGRPPATPDRDAAATANAICRELQWDSPGTPEELADRWAAELERHAVGRAALIASVPNDEPSVAAAVQRHPRRFVGFFMVNPGAPEAPERVAHALTELGLRGVCLFPAMHHVRLDDERVERVVEAASRVPGAAVFVHCGVLSVGVRRKLGLASHFDLRLGDPLSVARLALQFPQVPFIIPHFGAGLFREALMAADVAQNIHLDTSSSNSWIRYTPGLTLETVLKTALGVVGARRVLFGTDSSFFPRGWLRPVYEEQRQAVRSAGLGASDEALVFGGNFERLFKPPG